MKGEKIVKQKKQKENKIISTREMKGNEEKKV